MWQKITKIFRRLPAEQASLRDDLQRFAPTSVLRQFPKEAEGAARLDVGALVRWVLLKDGRGLEETLSLGEDKSAESMLELGDRAISAALAECLASAIRSLSDSGLPALNLDLLLAVALERGLNEEKPGLGAGTFPDAARVAASAFMARAIRWSQPERALGLLASIPNQPGIEAVLALSELEAWLLARKALLCGSSPESWQSDLEAARRILEQGKGSGAELRWQRELELAQVLAWSGEAERGAERLQGLEKSLDPASRESVELARGLWSLRAAESLDLAHRYALAQLECLSAASAEALRESEEEVGQGERSERLWAQAERFQRRFDEALEAAFKTMSSLASLRLAKARRLLLNDELVSLEDGCDADGALRELDVAIEAQKSAWLLRFERAQVRLYLAGGELELGSDIYENTLRDLEGAAEGGAYSVRMALANFRLQASLQADEAQAQKLCELAWVDFRSLLGERPKDHASLSGALQSCPNLEDLRKIWAEIEAAPPADKAEKQERNELTALASRRFQELGDEETGTSLMKSLVGQELEALKARAQPES